MLALILASLLGFSLFFELILRISTLCFHFPQGLRHYSAVARGMKRALYMPDPHSLYKLRPGRYRIGGLRITVNEAGFRHRLFGRGQLVQHPRGSLASKPTRLLHPRDQWWSAGLYHCGDDPGIRIARI